ncbi:ABC transporter substrate-binding protein [Cohnella sp. CIP 111063]|uniref:extracellular solute-binding protein n=1 Tax=unclassified Cohnella TaxID=2636738 RepID=UPI000B8BEA19|nr:MULTISPECIES: extracellular solute-binding protein [unclassified Cohnella]OXS55592.1 ABC transporter substrate-binding protein [Cohnella sp. CIP 111063]PRX66437.1 ABC-type glycerol-3-phosphate transport system substrate-binding protein [Cohnella sp. SGD-V74]
MRREQLKWIAYSALAAAAVISLVVLFSGGSRGSAAAEDRPFDVSSLASYVSYKQGGYDEYLAKHADADRPLAEIRIDGGSFSRTEGMSATALSEFEGVSGKLAQTRDAGSITWEVDVEQPGLYQIGIKYYTVKGKDSDIERELEIDGASPFREAKSLIFNRVWKDADGGLERDGRGNDLTPKQEEAPMWREAWLKDATGYYEEPYLFYFTAGKHELTLASIKEPLVIAELKLTNPDTAPSYEELANRYKELGYRSAEGTLITVQGETAAYKSDSMLAPYNDRSSPAVEPYHTSKLRINAAGGWAWRMPGQWIEWEFEAPEDGLYQIAVKNRQNYLTGMSSLRTLYVDGEIPFREAKRIGFAYDSAWQTKVLGNGQDDPYLFYLTKGRHSVRLEVTLGEIAPIVRAAESSILELNAIYRKIISYTGVVPDAFRDYALEKRIPEMSDAFREQSERLKTIAAIIEGPDGGSNDRSALLNTLAYQLSDMADRPDTVPGRLDSFKNNVGALGAWLLMMTEQPLAIDYLLVSTPGAELPDPDATRWEKLRSETASFAASFYENYDDFGGEDGAGRSVSVWITSARDQAQIVKRLIDDSFTRQTGISVNLKLVSADILLPSTVSGEGPDIALQVGNEVPVNFATRNALQDLSVFPDFDEVRTRFEDSAMVPFAYNGGYYGLPEQLNFPVLFYRKDIIEDELKLKVPQTWEDVYALVPELQKRNLQFGLPQKGLNAQGNDLVTTDIITLPPSPTYAMLLYQHDGRFYTDGDMASGLDEEVAIEQFKKWTDLYVNYKLPIQVDFANRFRTGEMPIGIIDYTMYNKLVVFAPEIKGLWDFAPVPGTTLPDGTIRRDVGGGGSAVVMFEHTEDKDAAWQFLKWWTSEETQLAFGREMEVRLGASARYPTANVAALTKLPWPTADLAKLMEQMRWVRGVPEVPGGYLTGRHIDNAFRRVVVQGDDPRETMEYYVRYMNEEITAKRKEFNLP